MFAICSLVSLRVVPASSPAFPEELYEQRLFDQHLSDRGIEKTRALGVSVAKLPPTITCMI